MQSIHTLAWISVCGILAASLVHRDALTIAVALVILLCVPGYDAQILTGESVASTTNGAFLALLPATWFLLLAVFARVVFSPESFRQRLAPQTGGLVWIVLAIAWAVVALYTSAGDKEFLHAGLSEIIDALITPLCLILLSSTIETPADASWLYRAILAGGAVEAIWAIFEYVRGVPILFTPPLAFAQTLNIQAVTGTFFRATGSFDHPLTLAVFLNVAIGCSVTVRNPPARLAIRALLFIGVAASGSRVATVSALILLAATSFKVIRWRQVVAAAAILAAAAFVLTSTPVGTLLAVRQANDLGSADVRSTAYQIFFHIFHSYVLLGNGAGASFTLSENLTGTLNSFESPFIMWTIDMGLVPTLALCLGLIRLATPRGANPILVISAVAAFATELTYSSFATDSSAGFVLAVAIAAARKSRTGVHIPASPWAMRAERAGAAERELEPGSRSLNASSGR